MFWSVHLGRLLLSLQYILGLVTTLYIKQVKYLGVWSGSVCVCVYVYAYFTLCVSVCVSVWVQMSHTHSNSRAQLHKSVFSSQL